MIPVITYHEREIICLGKRCSLCGGKLNSRGICTECGLDNSKSDKNYRINRSDCDGMPLTHVHGEKEKHRPDRKADHREINHKETNHKKEITENKATV